MLLMTLVLVCLCYTDTLVYAAETGDGSSPENTMQKDVDSGMDMSAIVFSIIALLCSIFNLVKMSKK